MKLLAFNYSKGDYQYLYCADLTCYLIEEVEYIWHVIKHQLTAAIQLFILANKIHSCLDTRHCIKRPRTLRRSKCHPTSHISIIIDFLESSLQDKIKTDKQNLLPWGTPESSYW